MSQDTEGVKPEQIPPDPTETKAPIPYTLADLLTEFDIWADKLEESKRTGEPLGPVTGIGKLDDRLGGYLAPGLHVLTGNTGSGKTALAMQIACQCGFPAVYVSCEMSALELLRRITARVTGTPLSQIKSPKFSLSSARLKELVRETARTCRNLVIADATLTYATPAWILDFARTLRRERNAEQVLVVMDSLHTWADWLEGDEYVRLNKSLKNVREISAELESPLLYIGEQNRESNKKGEKAGANAGAGSRKIEYGAESVMSLFVQPGDGDAFGNKEGTLTIEKNRNGAAGTPIPVIFNGKLQRFEEA